MDPLLPPLDEMLDSWLFQLRAQRKSRHTLAGYKAGVTAFLKFCADQGLPAELTKDAVIAFMANNQCQASTARLQLTVLKLFAKWMAAEEKFDADPILAVKQPKQDLKSVPGLSDDEVRRLLKACGGDSLRDKRDKALAAVFVETGLRAAEALALDVGDVDLYNCTLHVRSGKGGKGRHASFSPATAGLLDRYRRARRAAGCPPDSGPLFIADRGGRLSYTGMVFTLKRRAAAAGVVGFHIHRLRHSMAVRWLKSGGSESGLMSQAGWTSRAMVDKYVRAASEELARDEFARLGLGIDDL